MLIYSVMTKIVLGFLTFASAQTPPLLIQPPDQPAPSSSQQEPVVPQRRDRVMCRQDDLLFSVRRSPDGTVFAVSFINDKNRLAIAYESLKAEMPNFKDEFVRQEAQRRAQLEASLPSVVGACALMQTCEFNEPGSPVLVTCKNEHQNRRRQLTVQFNESNAYEVKCEEWVMPEKGAPLPTLESNDYTAFRKQLVLDRDSCR